MTPTLPLQPFSLLVKPTSADCNLRCAYCFYLKKSALYPQTPVHRMSDAVLERLIASYMATKQPQYAFGWQGGEPTLMGPEFFRRVTSLQNSCGRPGAVVANGLQTNATLLTDELAGHLGRYRFLVGVSLDGAPEVHDRYRTTADGRGSHAQVLEGLACLRRHDVATNALVLVNAANVARPAETFRYLCDLGLCYHQYVPCVEFDPAGHPLPFAIRGKEWGEFLCGIFEEWLRAGVRAVSVRLFDSILAALVEGAPTICHMRQDCCQYFVVEHNGDVYPCDFFVQADLKLGNVMEGTWADFQRSARYAAFGRQKRQWHARCRPCEYLALCAGDCLKHRIGQGRDPRTLSWLCEGWQRFYAHSLPTFRKIAEQARQERRLSPPLPDGRAAAPGRNAPCPCGSGRKYKHCCGAGV